MAKWVHTFGNGKGRKGPFDPAVLGGKGANLAEMASIGLPVPPGFTLTTEVCAHFYSNGRDFPKGLEAEVLKALDEMARQTGRKFGSAEALQLVSVRSGAQASMPGMLDTVLNLGLNDKTVVSLSNQGSDERFAWDSYRRFIQMYSHVVLHVDHGVLEDILEEEKARLGADLDTELTAEHWKHVCGLYKETVKGETGGAFPQDPHEQLWGAIRAVFESWMSPRAVKYRQLHGIPEDWGTAVNVQAMVFGNMGDTSATGVAFTRNPSTGENQLYGEFLINAQGEDVVAGLRTPQNITEAARIEAGSDRPSLEKHMPDAFAEFSRMANMLERHYGDMQDIEFTIERGKLWMLQTRSGKRTAKAALRVAADMAAEGLITSEEAVLRIDPASLVQLLHPTIDPNADRNVVAVGLPASPGAATGEIVFTPDEAETARAEGRSVILVRVETSPEDIHGMHAAQAILTARGGMTSHAAVVARGMGKPCVSGAGTLRIDYRAGQMLAAGRTFKRGDIITVDGGTGQVLAGAVPMLQPELSGDFARIMEWADAARRMHVRANADTPADARTARSFGAEGIGLCRTEHMFFEDDRIDAMREMILAEDEAGRKIALDKLLPMQRSDFVELFEIMAGLPVTIRLLDPPLHEFLPKHDDEIADVAASLGIAEDKLRRRMQELHEFNPMLGHRGCRLAISYPEIAEMQARAIFEAAVRAGRETGMPVTPEIMVPLVGLREELDYVKDRIDTVARAVIAEGGVKIDYIVGTMIELPRAAVRAHIIAEAADFFSFGTNDLTQTTFGISRDDAAVFIDTYLRKGIVKSDPFVSIDVDGVGELMRLASEKGRATRPALKLGICGEHGGDPASIAFCEAIDLDYVSCSPFRVPIARLAAAQATIRASSKDA